ncbi:hypothetical protein GPALN_004161 [Globodera pallida]|nr:hypothetical protein GPALN_004161 [Globodera pallida]
MSGENASGGGKVSSPPSPLPQRPQSQAGHRKSKYLGELVWQVDETVFCGGIESVQNQNLLCRLNIEYIVDLSGQEDDPLLSNSRPRTECPCLCPRRTAHSRMTMSMKLKDDSSQQMLSRETRPSTAESKAQLLDREQIVRYFETLIDLIRKARISQKKVLIHSLKGRNRAPAFVAAYLMHCNRITRVQAINRITKLMRSTRPGLCISDSLQRALMRWQFILGIRAESSRLDSQSLNKMFAMAASSLVLIFLHFLSSFGGICSVFVSHGVRQRNSSVPLREVVGTSRATALIAPFQQQTMAGRQAVRGAHEDCPYCEPKKCSGGPRAAGGRVGLCLTIRDGDGLLVSNRCVGSRKELNRAMFGCERTAGTAAAALAEEEGTEAMVEELCWCEAAQHRKSLLEEGLANSQRASSIQHSRRRKNHRGMAPSYRKPHSTDNSTTVPEQQQQQLPYHRLPYSSAVEYSSDRAQSDAAVASGSATGPQFIIQTFNNFPMAVSSVLDAKDGESDNGAGGNGIRAKLARGRKRLIGRSRNAGGDDWWWTKATRNVMRRFPQFAALSDRFRVFISSTRLCQSVRRRHNSQMRGASKRAERQIRRFVPVLLVLSVFVYVLLGAAAFLFFEHTNHEQSVRNWFFELIANRHKFARQISSAIFNGTRNMLVIVDYDSSERIQRDLVHLLSQYERKLSLRVPDLNEWTLENSLAYAWGLLTTIGHGHRAPKTRGGQLFALFYCLLGVPFFVVTLLVVSHRLFELCRLHHPLVHRHLLLMLLVLGLHTLWLLLFSFILYGNAISESYWRSLYTAVLSSLTIQSADYNALSERHKLLCLGGATLSLLHSFVAILSLTGAYRRKSRSDGAAAVAAETTLAAVPTAEEGAAPKRRGSAGRGGSLSTNATQPTFHMTVVDESGDTKLVLASPDSIDAKNCGGNER